MSKANRLLAELHDAESMRTVVGAMLLARSNWLTDDGRGRKVWSEDAGVGGC